MYNFAVKNTNFSGQIFATWVGKSTVAASSQSIKLEVYHFPSSSWQTVATQSTGCSASDCTITGLINADPKNYLGKVSGEDYYTYWRLWQGSAAETLYTDTFNVTFQPSWLRHGRYFDTGAEQPFTF
jgi:hypothetical protein